MSKVKNVENLNLSNNTLLELERKINLYKYFENTEVINPVKMGKWFGFKMLQADLSKYDNIKGFCVIRKNNNVKEVIVSTNLSNKEKRELYAYGVVILLMSPSDITHNEDIVIKKFEKNTKCEEEQQLEDLYKKYVYELLMPKKVFVEEYNLASKHLSAPEIESHLSARFDVPQKLIKIRINERKRIKN